jgi:hypothetical protein
MEIRKLDINEAVKVLKDRKKFKDVVVGAIEYLTNRKGTSDIHIIKIKEILQVVKEMLGVKNSEYDRRISIKIGLVLNDLGVETFNSGKGKEFIISKTELEIIKHANKR